MIDERQKPYQTAPEEQALRWDYGKGKITLKEFHRRYAKLKKQGLIKRNGRVIK